MRFDKNHSKRGPRLLPNGVNGLRELLPHGEIPVRPIPSGVVAGGFTLVELVAILIIIGILAVAVLPRFADQSAFEARGFYDETLSILRYGQKAAVAQRRMVCATFTATSVTLQVATNFGGACDKDLTGPGSSTPYQVNAHGPVQFSPVPAAISFNPDGSASTGAIIQVSGASNAITLDGKTGYAY